MNETPAVDGARPETEDELESVESFLDLPPSLFARPIDWARWGRYALSFLIVAACCGYIFWVVHPELVLLNTTATGGDMGAHVWGPAYLRDHLLTHGRLTGWTPDWYAGFPAYTFYMVVPSLLIVAIDVGFVPYFLAPVLVASFAMLAWGVHRRLTGRLVRVLAFGACAVAPVLMVDIPYNIAFKVVAVSGVVMLPAAVWVLGRGLSLRTPGPELMAIASVPFLMDQKLFHIYGGNIGSTMAGEFAFSISLTLSIAALGVVARGMNTGKHRALGAVMLALAALCHVIPAFFALVGVLVLVVLRSPGLGHVVRKVGWITRLRAALLAALAAGALAGWWLGAIWEVWVAFAFLVGACVAFLPGRRAGIRAYFREMGRGVRYMVVVGPVAALLAAWWYVPFYGRRAYLNDMGWEKLGIKAKDAASALTCPLKTVIDWTEMKRYLLPFAPHIVNGTPNDDPNMLHGKIFFVLAAVGVLLSIVMMVRAGLMLALVTGISAVAFIYMPQDRFWNARVLPFYYLCIYLLAGIGVYLLLRALVLVFSGLWVDPWTPLGAVAVVLSAAVVFIYLGFTMRALPWGHAVDASGNVLPAGQAGVAYRWAGITAKSSGDARGWAAWNFSGLQNKPSEVDHSSWIEYKAMIDKMDQIGRTNGCGRAFWEYDSGLEQYGTPMAPMLLPYFTDSCIGSMEGLYFEASSTTPYHFLVQSELSQSPSQPERFDCHLNFTPAERPYQSFNLDEGIKHLQMLGVRYFMALTDATKRAAASDPRLHLVGHSDAVQPVNGKSRTTGWDVYEVADVSLVQPLANLPSVYTDVSQDIHEWAKPTIEWFNDEKAWNVYRAAFGPSSWPSGKAADPAKVVAAPHPDLKVSHVTTSLDTLSFDVDKIGSPVLIRTSYFPNWEVSGADGPYRVTPNFMVVVPTSHHVELTYGRSAMEYIAWFATLVGIIVVGYLILRPGPERDEEDRHEFFGDRDPKLLRRDGGDLDAPDPPESSDDFGPPEGSEVFVAPDGSEAPVGPGAATETLGAHGALASGELPPAPPEPPPTAPEPPPEPPTAPPEPPPTAPEPPESPVWPDP